MLANKEILDSIYVFPLHEETNRLQTMLQAVKTEQFSDISARLIIKTSDINNNNYKVFNGEIFLRSDLTFRTAWDLWQEYRLKVLQASLEAEIVFTKYDSSRQVSLNAF